MNAALAPVALNGRFSGTPQPTGTQTAAFHLYDGIIRAARPRPIVVFADPRFDGVAAWADVPLTTLVEVPFQDWSRWRAQFWEQFVFPRRARRFGCALAHHPITTCPFWQAGMRTVVTVHDLSFHLHPEWYALSFRLVFRCFALPGIRRAHGVVTISDYVREQVLRHLHLPPGKVRRIYNGVRFRVSHPEAVPTTTVGVPYILCVGSLQPHKNLVRLIRAWEQLHREQPELELWIVGRPQPRFRRQPELSQLLESPGVRLPGYLSDKDLLAAYQGARVFCFPSLEEGFGLPLLEAMTAGTPVVTSRTSCLPEIGGPACELIDPESVESIAAGLRRVLDLTEPARQKRIEQGRAWATEFSWEKSARAYLDYFEELLAESPSQMRRATSGPS